ncbi:hypothetical protein ACJIZ3_006527 [Penstemon smallii]|uniref:Uncharacterized protein n=1 Tax=Penstemon smallii TaxID=265156 RepID=A0ABD3S828_9LAMI
MYKDNEKCPCGKLINREINLVVSKVTTKTGEVFTVKTSSFLISDDLRMLPNVTGSFLQSIKHLGITDTDGAEQMTVTIGFNELISKIKIYNGSIMKLTPYTKLKFQFNIRFTRSCTTIILGV